MAGSLGIFAQQPAAHKRVDNSLFFRNGTPAAGRRLSRARGLALVRGPSGSHALVHGNIDNRAAVAAELAVPADDLDRLYLAAFERWGDACDFHLVGDYCSLIELPGGSGTRLARSPWRGPPLVFTHDAQRTIVASVPRVLLAGGLPAELDERHLADNLALSLAEGRGWYKGSFSLDVGQLAWLRPDGSSHVHAYYDPLTPRRTRLPRRRDYVEAADALLKEAIGHALDGARVPGALLSGGLDSSNITARAVEHLPAGQSLKTFTFRPHANFREAQQGMFIGDEWRFVEAFAAQHPRIEPHWAKVEDYDQQWERMFLAIGCAPYALQNMAVYEPILALAQAQGCDVMIDSGLGNYTFSADALWGYPEYLARGRWIELYRAVAALRPAPRPVALGCLWHGIGAALPDTLWSWYQRRMGREDRPFQKQVAVLSETAAQRHLTWDRLAQKKLLTYRSWMPSRRRWLTIEYGRGSNGMGEVNQGLEQIYGLRIRDAAAYRPLIEFCHGLPTDLFLHDGVNRWLARELGRGRLPEVQRTSRLWGLHNCDWHERITPRLGEWAATIRAAREDPLLSRVLDFDRLDQLMAEWPAQSSLDRATMVRFAMALPRAVSAARFVQYATGTNR
ncbi:MAG: asparagine synthase-related protein [Croceibacterium sp.]